MCVAVPRRVLQVEEDSLLVEVDGRPMQVQCAGMADLTHGDYVLVYAGHAVTRLEAAEAEELLAFYATLDSVL